MKMSLFNYVCTWSFLLSLAATFAYAEKPTSAKNAPPVAQEVELFAAMEAGEIEVKLILKDATAGNVLIKNKTDKPLSIKLPAAFAGVPVLAQGFGGGNQGGGGLGVGGGGGNQGVGGGGGGFGGGQGGGGFGGGGFGGFRVEPEKVGKIKVVTVCLEHGKADPNPHVEYAMKPLESFTSKPEVLELVKMLSRGEIDQHSAQAAAWNLANGLSWQELTAKIGVKHLNGTTEPFFTSVQLQRGFSVAQEAQKRASSNSEKTQKSDSLSNQ